MLEKAACRVEGPRFGPPLDLDLLRRLGDDLNHSDAAPSRLLERSCDQPLWNWFPTGGSQWAKVEGCLGSNKDRFFRYPRHSYLPSKDLSMTEVIDLRSDTGPSPPRKCASNGRRQWGDVYGKDGPQA